MQWWCFLYLNDGIILVPLVNLRKDAETPRMGQGVGFGCPLCGDL
jgi:hypothetical protein